MWGVEGLVLSLLLIVLTKLFSHFCDFIWTFVSCLEAEKEMTVLVLLLGKSVSIAPPHCKTSAILPPGCNFLLQSLLEAVTHWHRTNTQSQPAGKHMFCFVFLVFTILPAVHILQNKMMSSSLESCLSFYFTVKNFLHPFRSVNEFNAVDSLLSAAGQRSDSETQLQHVSPVQNAHV